MNTSTEAASTVNVTVVGPPWERRENCAGLFGLSTNPNSLAKRDVTVNWADGLWRMGRRSERGPSFAEMG